VGEQAGLPAGPCHRQADFQVGRRDIGCRPLRPFHEAYPVAGKVFVQPCIEILFWKTEPIKIKVI
jgi:hypothetical protein